MIFLIAVGCLFIGYLVGKNDGWVAAHKEVARECRQLGSFYVGSTTFKCVEVKHNYDNI